MSLYIFIFLCEFSHLKIYPIVRKICGRDIKLLYKNDNYRQKRDEFFESYDKLVTKGGY